MRPLASSGKVRGRATGGDQSFWAGIAEGKSLEHTILIFHILWWPTKSKNTAFLLALNPFSHFSSWKYQPISKFSYFSRWGRDLLEGHYFPFFCSGLGGRLLWALLLSRAVADFHRLQEAGDPLWQGGDWWHERPSHRLWEGSPTLGRGWGWPWPWSGQVSGRVSLTKLLSGWGLRLWPETFHKVTKNE